MFFDYAIMQKRNKMSEKSIKERVDKLLNVYNEESTRLEKRAMEILKDVLSECEEKKWITLNYKLETPSDENELMFELLKDCLKHEKVDENVKVKYYKKLEKNSHGLLENKDFIKFKITR